MNTARLTHRLSRIGLEVPPKITKRDGSLVTFDPTRIQLAIAACFLSEGVADVDTDDLTQKVVAALAGRCTSEPPNVEQVQDMVEITLLSAGQVDAARAYIRYRDEHASLRKHVIPQDVHDAFQDDRQFLPTPLQRFQFYDKYSRYNWELGRRETWVETVDRCVSFLRELSASAPNGDVISENDWDEVRTSILRQHVMPSMRLLASAGETARRNNMAVYNCSYEPVSSLDAFPEALLISMAGCGVGYSVERRYVDQLPRIARITGHVRDTYFVEDTTEGWGDALRAGIDAWVHGDDIQFDTSMVRKAGAILRTKGGRASGPGPLLGALNLIRTTIRARAGSILRPIDAHDMMCGTGDAAVAGGVRRTAMIALFDWDDQEMRECKSGDLVATGKMHRFNANNSAVWPGEMNQMSIVRQMLEMAEAGSGEPGIFSRENATRMKPERRSDGEFGTNPCGEILLRGTSDGGGLCNLSSVIARSDDTEEDLMRKVRVATIIGTVQSLATNFPGLRDGWKRNAEEERLLGVDINGQRDCPAVQDAGVMERLKAYVLLTNEMLAFKMGIHMSAAMTCVKPNGNSSLFVDCASGLHARFARYYIRRARVNAHAPLCRVLRDAGVPLLPEVWQVAPDISTYVAEFPVKAPKNAVVRKDITAIDQCEYWLLNKLNWTEHNPSATINYAPDELLDITKWVWDNRDVIGGLTFMPSDQTVYALAPYEEIDEQEYLRRSAAMPDIDFSLLYRYEHDDMTTASQELSCFAGQCEV